MIYVQPDQLLAREKLRRLPPPEKAERLGNKWRGQPHIEVADALCDRLRLRGFQVRNETWFLNPNQSDLFGSVDLLIKESFPDGILLSVGVRHSNAGRYGINLFVGARVSCCENGLIYGRLPLRVRHTGKLELRRAIAESLKSLEAEQVILFVQKMRSRDLDELQFSALLIHAFRSRVISTKLLGEIDRRWRFPESPEFEPRTVWTAFNCFTSVAKGLAPPAQFRLLEALRPIFEGLKLV